MNQFSLFAAPEPSIEGIDARKAFASYSGDTIGEMGKVRKPVSCGGDLWINTGGCSARNGQRSAEMYRLVSISDFDGQATTYTAKLSIVREGDRYPGDYARSDPNGFYHAVTVKSGASTYVLCGPPQILIAPEDRSLFTADDDEDDPESLGLFDEDGGLEDEEDLDEPCDVCGDDLSQADFHIVTACGRLCPLCSEVHRANCKKCNGVDVLLVSPELETLLAIAAEDAPLY